MTTSATAFEPVDDEPEIQLFAWNPVRETPSRVNRALPRRLRRRRPLNNFGDLLGPQIVRAVARSRGLDPARPTRSATVMSVGSALHLAPRGAVVWGSGINGKMPSDPEQLRSLDIRAVRGPRTRERLAELGVEVPEVYGDPAVLLPLIRPDLVGLEPQHEVTVVPNFNDASRYRPPFTDPREPVEEVLLRLARSELVVGSSLHAIIVAEALGVPARLVLSEHEHAFKYADYYGGTGRDTYTPASSVAEAVAMGGEPASIAQLDRLLAAFPAELWRPEAPSARPPEGSEAP